MDRFQNKIIHSLMVQHSTLMVQLTYRRIGDWQTETCEIELSLEYHLPDGLNEQEKKLLLARIEEERSIPEIAEALGISEVACRQRLSRAVRKCRELMELDGLAPK